MDTGHGDEDLSSIGSLNAHGSPARRSPSPEICMNDQGNP